MVTKQWLTNNPEAAAKLLAADLEYAEAIKAATGLCLDDKIVVHRNASIARAKVYDSFKPD
jgi:hypothetical protein